MPWTYCLKALAPTVGMALAAMAIAATAVTTAAPSRAACDDGTVGADSCLADCPENQLRDADSGQCAAKANENADAPLKQAWEDAFGPLPSPSDFALARVDNPSVALPGVGLPGVNALTIAPAIGAGAALPSIGPPPVGLPALPTLPEVGPPALPGPPPLPCFGFGTPIPFVGFSTC